MIVSEFLLKEQLDELEPFAGAEVIQVIKEGQLNTFESFEHLNLISFYWQNILENYVRPNRLIICHMEQNIFFICEDQEILEQLSKLFNKDEVLPGKMLYTFFSQLLKSDTSQMEDLEEQITELEDAMLKENKTDCIANIMGMRKQMLRLKRYYEQINQVLEGLLENESQLVSKEELKFFHLLDKKVDRLLSQTLNLRDYVTQVREAYQAQIDIEQNNLMKVFTVVTTIFLPLTLIAGWYGMNLDMPELNWRFSYLYVIVLSIAVAVGLLIYFKRKKWF